MKNIPSSKSASVVVRGVTVVPLKVVRDPRGDLMVGEFGPQIPFAPMRFFTVFNVPPGSIRGDHAHKRCHQFLVCLRGSCTALVDDGVNQDEHLLDSPGRGLYMPPRIWGTQHRYSSDAILLVFASHLYDADDYLRKREDFLTFLTTSPP